MFSKLKIIVTQRVHPFALLTGSLTAVVLLTALAGIWHHNYELDHQLRKTSSQPEAQTTASAQASTPVHTAPDSLPPIDTGITGSEATQPAGSKPTNQPRQQTQSTPSPAAMANQPSASPATPPPSRVAISLSVNDTYKGEVSVAATGTQCDVLLNAREAGIITSLDMRYSAQYKTYAVYVIEGKGDSGAIWWTYTVNGKSPPYGCSGTKVAAGDSVNWKYVKQ